MLPDVQPEHSVFQFVPTVSALVPVHHLNERDSIIPTFSLHVYIVIDEAPPEPPLLQSE